MAEEADVFEGLGEGLGGAEEHAPGAAATAWPTDDIEEALAQVSAAALCPAKHALSQAPQCMQEGPTTGNHL